MSHVTHFYHLAALSYVQGPNMAPWTPYFDNSYYHALTQKPAGRDLPVGTDVWDKVIADYVVALGIRRVALDVAAMFSGRTPMEMNLVVGGTGYVVDTAKIAEAKTKLLAIKGFIENNYIPLVAIVGGVLYPEYFSIGQGHGNLLAWGVFPLDNTGAAGDIETGQNRLLKRGYRLSGGATGTPDPDAQVFEHIKNSRYTDDPTKTVHKNTGGLQPKNGYTNPDYSAGYSWGKAPRLNVGGTHYPMEVGPLARMVVNGDYVIGSGTAVAANHAIIGNLGTVNFTKGISVMDRHVARALEALKIVTAMTETGGWLDQLAAYGNGATGYTDWAMPSGTVEGYGAHEAPRGALAHWVKITNGKIANYQAVVPTTWNVSPADANGVRGPIEQSIFGAPISGVKSGTSDVPVEAMRIVQSFDPCIACTVHVVDGEKLSGKEV
ncbi:MAG: nickel-dependent hydrogenase large subunit [Candidatus Aquicultorales bacterium]